MLDKTMESSGLESVGLLLHLDKSHFGAHDTSVVGACRLLLTNGQSSEGSQMSGENPEAETNLTELESEDSGADLGTPRIGSDSEKINQEPAPSALFKAPGTPSYIAKDSYSLTFKWEPCQVLGKVNDTPEVAWTYVVEMQQIDVPSGRSTPDGGAARTLVKADKWREVYAGVECWTQVRCLRPGRYYAMRVKGTPVRDGPTDEREHEESLAAPEPSSVVVFHTTPTIPSAPQPPALAVRDKKSLTFKWNDPEETGGTEIVEFRLQLRPGPEEVECYEDEGFYEVYCGPERMFKVVGLQPAVKYTARVKVRNEFGEGPWSLLSSFKTKPSIPSEPKQLAGEAVPHGTVVLEWVPAYGNGACVERYCVDVEDLSTGDHKLVRCGPEHGCKVHGLRDGCDYKFKVRAENKVGKSPWSSSVCIYTEVACPDAPLPPLISRETQSSAVISWMPPEDAGGDEITSYQVELMPVSRAACRGTSKAWHVVYQDAAAACTLNGLRLGCSYKVKVKAGNSAGWGPASTPVEFQTRPGVPYKPPIPTATSRTATSLSIAWGTPQHDGGAPITTYRLEYCMATSQSGIEECEPEQYQLAYSGPSKGAVVTELAPGTVYSFRVVAGNNYGESDWSDMGYESTKPGAPSMPSGVSVKDATGDSFTLEWQEAEFHGSAAVSYAVEMASGVTDGALENGDASGVDVNSQAPSVDERNRQVEGSEAESVDLCELNFQRVYEGAATTCCITGLKPSEDYVVRVRAQNKMGCSEWSPQATVSTSAAPPGPPECFRAGEITCNSVRLSWRAPSSDNGSPVTSYVVERSRVASRKQLWLQEYEGSDLSCDVRQLSCGTDFQFRIRACNAKGMGVWQRIQLCTPPDVPSQPEPPTISQKMATSVRVRWMQRAEQNGAPVTCYRLEMAEGEGEFTTVYTGRNLAHPVASLRPGREYSFRIQSENSAGCSAWSECTSVRTNLAAPLAPANLRVAPKTEQAVGQTVPAAVEWEQAERHPECAEANSYEVEAVQGAFDNSRVSKSRVTKVSSKQPWCQFPSLQAGVQYSFRVRALGAQRSGHSKWSEAVVVNLPAAKSGGESGSDALSRKLVADPPSEPSSVSGGRNVKGGRVQSDMEEAPAANKGRSSARTSVSRRPPAIRPRPKRSLKRLAKFVRNNFPWALFSIIVFAILFLVYLARKW